MNIHSDKKVLIGIVTVLFNSNDVLPGFFASLALQTDLNYILYVIDNSLEDSGCHICNQLSKKYGIKSKIVFNNSNYGVAKGNNLGIRMALEDECSYILLANNDTEFQENTIANLLGELTSTVLAATPKIMYFSKPDTIWYAGGRIDNLLIRTPHYGIGELDKGQHDNHTFVTYAPTCFFLISSKVFRQVGFMDEKFFVYYDDTDFLWRVNLADIPIAFVPNAVVLHKVSFSTGGNRSSFTLYYTNRNRVYFIRKNLKYMAKYIALSYCLFSRIPHFFLLPPFLSTFIVRGIRDGFKMDLATSPAVDTKSAIL